MLMRWPWISIVLIVVVVASPLGQEVIHDGFFSGEALSRNIAQPLFFMGLGFFVLIGAAEWLVRLRISKRRMRGTTT
ncbi:MAG TPA: hypothetical protein VFL62_08475 [Bradyrhizobium sp.]|uniref:hypothetical protein n=1 Tax=Bradyrhizobium sp. TaxID=376 RepID=UPI002D7E8DB0|nr:hypothetical protein [Bradyrhizobium sp.]HET7886245.1 hypothetical protein [Bradyrhizobium sp.]